MASKYRPSYKPTQFLPGEFLGLHLLAIMFTALRQIDPAMDTGADFTAEYQAALQMQEQ